MTTTLKNRIAQAIEAEERLANSDNSLQSRVLHWLGCVFIGQPEALGMPTDFYFARQDRHLPTPAEGDSWQKMRFRVYVDRVRVAMIRRFCKIILALNLAVFFAAVLICFIVGGFNVIKPTPAAEPENLNQSHPFQSFR